MGWASPSGLPEASPASERRTDAGRVWRVALAIHRLRTGGMGRYVLTLGHELARRGHTVAIVVTEERGEWFDLAVEGGLSVRMVEGIERRSGIDHARAVGRALSALAPDFVILNHARHAQLALALLPATTRALPFVHGDNQWIYRLALANPAEWDCLLAPSPVVAAGIARRAPTAPHEVLAHGIELPPPLQVEDPRRSVPSLKLLYLGRLDRGKGLDRLPLIVRELVTRGVAAELRVAGDGPERDTLRRLAEGLPINLLGAQTPAAASRLLRESHALLLPTESEGLPLSLLEAQAEGCVPLATAIAGSTDLAVADGETGFLLPRGDVAGYAEALARLAADREFWSGLSRAGRTRVETRFSAAAMGDRYEALFQRLATRSLRPHTRRGRLDLRLFAPRDHLPALLRRSWEALRDRP